MKTVAILTNFSSYFRAYSLNIVAERQIKMLVANGYKPKVIVMETFTPEGAYDSEDVTIYKIPNIKCHNEWKQDSDPEVIEDAAKIKGYLEEYLKDVDVVMTHDMLFQASMQKYEIACRGIAKDRPNMRWLLWVHSATSSNNKRPKFPNSFLVYPNAFDVPRVAKAFGYEEPDVKVVPHPIDVCDFFDMHEKSKEIIDKHNILSADVVMTYPLRLDRGKQPEMCIKIAKQLKLFGKTVRVIFMDFHSTGGDKAKYREELKQLAIDSNLGSDDVIFTSEESLDLKLECPRKMVKDFMCISNVFCQPSKSETFSLVAQEAGICGNFMILNYDFPAMRSIYGGEPIYRKFSSCIDVYTGEDGSTDTTYKGEDYFRDIAGYINYMLEHDRVLSMRTKIRRDHNLKAVFRKYLEPLIYYE